eukprot:7201397-Pyramimonas_sp.AAC.1
MSLGGQCEGGGEVVRALGASGAIGALSSARDRYEAHPENIVHIGLVYDSHRDVYDSHKSRLRFT